MEKPKRTQNYIRLDTLITQAKNEAQKYIDEEFTYLALSSMANSSFEKRDSQLFVIFENRKRVVDFDKIEQKIQVLVKKYRDKGNTLMVDKLHDLTNHIRMFDPNYSPRP